MRRRGLPPIPKRVAENGRRPCRGCGSDVPKGRLTWCSNECKEVHYMALSGHARARVAARDKGVCAKCGADSGLVDRIMSRLYWRNGRSLDNMKAMELICAAWGQYATYGWNIRHLWEADHAVPLAEGGTNELANYRTLCIPCHKEETRALRRRISKRGVQQELGVPASPHGAPLSRGLTANSGVRSPTRR